MLFAFLTILSAYAGPVAPPTSPFYTPLDEYVARPDSNYRYEVHSEYPIHGKYWKGTILKMYSQQWLQPSDWNRGNPNTSDAIWWHWMTVVVPDQLDPKKSDHGVLWITGGSNNDGPPDDPTTEDNGILASLCMDMGVVGAALYQIPNQPIYFTDDPSGKGRTEDAFIAWTWHHFLMNTSDLDWPARLPMTKAAVRAMDTLADFRKDTQNVTKFIVSGASKRGWTTWTAGLTDDRVVLIIPIVLDALHLTSSLHHMWRAYGGWTFTFSDYYDVNLTAQLDTPQFASLCRIEDPYNYLSDPTRLNMPKLVINAVMDEFLQGDNDQFWWDRIHAPNQTYRLMCPDAEHSEITGIPEIMLTIAAWGNAYFQGVAWPRFNWTINDTDGTITFVNQPQYGIPINVSMWYAPSFHRFDGPYLRDWRIAGGYPVTLPQVYTWRRDVLNETAPGSNTWIARQPTPENGWNAFYIEAYYYGPKPYYDPSRVTTYRFTTQISIVPKYKWYMEDCYDEECYGTLV